LRIRDAQADIVFVNPKTQDTADLLFQQLAEQPISARLFANDVVMEWQEGLTQYSTLVEGMIGSEVSFEDRNPEFMDIKEKLDYPAYSATTYDAVMIIAEALTKFGNDAEKVKEYLYTIKDRPGLSGKLTIDENGDPVAGRVATIVIRGNVEKYEEPAL
ncbi:hypothetical protein HZA41_02705, partial [Candidatus Peregrinibacteria bacterium]|nr:hypothetical protein [Candidatus Peregrinibacteria bacterium]